MLNNNIINKVRKNEIVKEWAKLPTYIDNMDDRYRIIRAGKDAFESFRGMIRYNISTYILSYNMYDNNGFIELISKFLVTHTLEELIGILVIQSAGYMSLQHTHYCIPSTYDAMHDGNAWKNVIDGIHGRDMYVLIGYRNYNRACSEVVSVKDIIRFYDISIDSILNGYTDKEDVIKVVDNGVRLEYYNIDDRKHMIRNNKKSFNEFKLLFNNNLTKLLNISESSFNNKIKEFMINHTVTDLVTVLVTLDAGVLYKHGGFSMAPADDIIYNDDAWVSTIDAINGVSKYIVAGYTQTNNIHDDNNYVYEATIHKAFHIEL